MSAIYEETEGDHEPLKVLITLHEGMDAMDYIGPLEVLTWARHDKKNPGMWSEGPLNDIYLQQNRHEGVRCDDHSSD